MKIISKIKELFERRSLYLQKDECAIIIAPSGITLVIPKIKDDDAEVSSDILTTTMLSIMLKENDPEMMGLINKKVEEFTLENKNE